MCTYVYVGLFCVYMHTRIYYAFMSVLCMCINYIICMYLCFVCVVRYICTVCVFMGKFFIFSRRNLRKASCASFRTGAGSVCSNYFQSRPASRRMSTYKLKLAS